MIRSYIVFIWAFLSVFVASAQPDMALADKFRTNAMAALDRNQIDSCEIWRGLELGIYQKADSLKWWLEANIAHSFAIAGYFNRHFDAVEVLDKALHDMWREPRSFEEWEQLTRLYEYQGYFFQYLNNDFYTASRYYETAFSLFVNRLHENSDNIAKFIYHQLGNTYTRLGDYTRAENLLRRGIEYGKKHNAPQMGKYGDLAIALMDGGKYQDAIEVINEGLAIRDLPVLSKVTTKFTEATVRLNQGDIQSANKALSMAYALIFQLPPEDANGKSEMLSGYHMLAACIQDSLGNAKQALFHYKKNIELVRQSRWTGFSREAGKAHCSLGSFLLRQKQPEAALAEFQAALKSVLKVFKPQDNFQNPPTSIFIAENTIEEALLGKAKAFVALGLLENALECYELVPVMDARLRATYAYESSSLFALSNSRQQFDDAISIAWRLYESSHQKREYADRAFQLSEQARGILLLKSLSAAQANYHLPENIRLQEANWNGKLAWYDTEIANLKQQLSNEGGTGNDRLAQLEKELFDLKQANEKFKSDLRQQYPAYATLSDGIRFLQSMEVPALLRVGQIMLNYYQSEAYLYVFSFDEDGNFSWRRESVDKDFRANVHEFVTYLQNGEEGDQEAARHFRQMAFQLYELLLSPELTKKFSSANDLIIVPDDALVFVPFETLLLQDSPNGNWRDLPWLLTKCNVGYAYSATLLKMQQDISRQHRLRANASKYSFAGFAPEYSTAGIYKLGNTSTMVKKARALFGGKNWFGPQASEANFKMVAPDCRLLLLAMHGIADAENPELSRFLFGDQLFDSLENDNILYASELQIMQLQADLAVLSACHSGFGKLQKGEGVYSLARAFARAGVPATVMSLWLLHENSAGPLVQGFLKYLQAGKTKDEALRLAKLDYLKDDQYFEMTHPFYWAGVTASGDMCALDLGASGWRNGWWLLLAMASILLCIIWIRKGNLHRKGKNSSQNRR
ncbi:MAG: CHAT domain-containing protein [Lewinellaceae bacterium]|nr:CHAT domain-containing protein [Saprospiraceae bacterium]MCB9344444.1 CHAT domain-containing protein [Lewinellaceae bacterium]